MIAEATTVLIVDDNEHDRAALKRYLRKASNTYSFLDASTVAEALELCIQNNPDCILLDYQLMDGTGLDFVRMLREQVPGSVYPIVMLAATGNEAIAVEAMKAGVQDYLAKGRTTSQILARAVREAIYRVRTQKTLDAQRAELQRLYDEAHEASLRKDQILRELEAAKVDAENANAAKDEFLATLSHELRTPLTPILSAVSAIDPETTERAELVQIFRMIQRNIELEARLIDDLLDLTRISKGKLHLDLHPVKFEASLQSTIAICSPEFSRRNILLQTDLRVPQASVLADSARLQQVFWNILKNAIKFTPRGGHVEISTRMKGDKYVEASIRDSGIGMDQDVLPRIFHPFEQGDRFVTRKFGGLGLGLAITKALVDVHGGQITAESAGVNKGATFRVCLPLAHVPAQERPSGGHDHVSHTPLVGGNILLVEDHDDTAAVLARSLRRKGFAVRIASSVESGVICFRREHFDLLISDIGLPDGSGIELMERIKRMRPIPAIALTGYGMEQDVELSREAGFAEHLTKPVNWESLLEAVERALAKPAEQAH